MKRRQSSGRHGARPLDNGRSESHPPAGSTRNSPAQAAHCIIPTANAERRLSVIALRAAHRRAQPDRVRRYASGTSSTRARDYCSGPASRSADRYVPLSATGLLRRGRALFIEWVSVDRDQPHDGDHGERLARVSTPLHAISVRLRGSRDSAANVCVDVEVLPQR